MNKPTILLIAGHGSGDPGATGYISKGEHRYMKENFFPAMRKFIPKGANIVFFSDYNVYMRGNLVALAKSYGPNTIVVEMHYDALGMDSGASGGHVIVHDDFVPDSIDLAIRDAIKKNVGVRYNYKGHSGISGRSNLANVNRAANGGVNYRLVELGFCTDKGDVDVMINKTEQYAKDFVEALLGKTTTAKPSTTANKVSSGQSSISGKSIDTLANEVIQGMHGSGDDRKRALGSMYNSVQKRVNEILANKGATVKLSVNQMAKNVIAGKYGTGEARKKALGANYNAVQAEVNRILGVSVKSVDTVAREVIDGKWGNGSDRRNRLTAAEYNYNAVQKRVNQLL